MNDTWLTELGDVAGRGGCMQVGDEPLPGRGRALALAPHPDDPEAVAVTLDLLRHGGWQVHFVIVTPAASGVTDAFTGPDPAVKAARREAEQREAARKFGLPPPNLRFLRLAETEDGHLAATAANNAALFACLTAEAPDLVLLPSEHDTNPSHRLVYRWLAAWAATTPHPPIALACADPKTVTFKANLRVVFGEERARWKAELLECHRSQSVRNQASRGMTFAERILGLNRADPDLAPGTYSERFQVTVWPGGR